MTDQDVTSHLLNINNKIKSNYRNIITSEEIEYLNSRYTDSQSIKETLLRIYYNIEIRPVCKICGQPAQFVGHHGVIFKDICNNKRCVNINKRNKTIQTCLEKYGVECVTQSNEFKDKCKQTKLERYGNEYWSNSEQASKTNKNRTDEQKQLSHEKTVKTCLERYGVVNGGCSKEALEKIKKTNLERRGVESSLSDKATREKAKLTCIKKYGKEYYQSTDEFKHHMSITISKEETLNKRWKTNIERHGCKTYVNNEKHINTCFDRYNVPYWNNCEKRIETMCKNGTFNTSKPEEQCYKIILEKFPTVIRQYKSDTYPFACDFYIPELDMYIEYNGSHYHGKHPFNEDDQMDIQKLTELKEKANSSIRHQQGKKSQYDNMIYVWTDLDVRKRNIAKQNNLNWYECWNIDDIIDLTNKYK